MLGVPPRLVKPLPASSEVPRLVRRCFGLLIEPRSRRQVDLSALLSGRAELVPVLCWIGLAAHLDAEVVLQDADLPALAQCPVEDWCEAGPLRTRLGEDRFARLLAAGLLIGDHPDHAVLRRRDQSARDLHWNTLSAVTHAQSRWKAVDTGAWKREADLPDTAAMVDRYEPAPAVQPRLAASQRDLPRAALSEHLNTLLRRRRTCRNFDPARPLSLMQAGGLLHAMAGVVDTRELSPGAIAVKKHAPAGGSLHATELFVLARGIEDLQSGLYHYLAADHAMEPLPSRDEVSLDALAATLLAHQPWFSNAPLLVFQVTRYERLYWKYRRHAKAWKVSILDAGHISMLGYLAATELGLGVFVSAALNDIDVEQAFGLDPLRYGVVCVNGFGHPLPDGPHDEWRG